MKTRHGSSSTTTCGRRGSGRDHDQWNSEAAKKIGIAFRQRLAVLATSPVREPQAMKSRQGTWQGSRGLPDVSGLRSRQKPEHHVEEQRNSEEQEIPEVSPQSRREYSESRKHDQGRKASLRRPRESVRQFGSNPAEPTRHQSQVVRDSGKFSRSRAQPMIKSRKPFTRVTGVLHSTGIATALDEKNG